MPEAAVETTTTQPNATTTTTTETPSLGWRAGLPDDLKQNADLTNYKTVGDFTKDALSWKSKASDLENRMADAVPKLPENATAEERSLYLNALGRPAKAREYEFDGEDKNAPEWTTFWKDQFHGLGLTKAQAKQLSGSFNGQIQKLVEAHNTSVKTESTAAEQKLRSEMGDKYDTNVELAKRMWQQHGEGEFDKAFDNAPGVARFGMIRALIKFAALTGEDKSPQSTGTAVKSEASIRSFYSKSPPPPAR